MTSSMLQKSQNPSDKKWGRERSQVQETAAFSSSQTRHDEGTQIPTSNVVSGPIASPPVTENFRRSALEADEGDGRRRSLWKVFCEVKALLNRLSPDVFESISDQIIAWANKSEEEKDARTLILVAGLIFEKARDDEIRSAMYARLCRKMMEQISQHVSDDEIKDTEGNLVTGGQLFRKYLLNRCNEEFELGWSMNKEVKLFSKEYYAALKAKKQGLGLVKFIGELFKVSLLTERIMHECIKKLLNNVDDPEEEEIESLCKLMTTVGQNLDTEKAKGHMDIYFSRMSELAKNEKLTSQMRHMLQHVVELRHRNWVHRSVVAGPLKRPQTQEATAKERAAQEKELAHLPSMSRGGFRRSERNRGNFNQNAADGWNVTGDRNQAHPAPKASDLSNFGKITKSGAMVNLDPSSVFKKEGNGRGIPQNLSRTASPSNMISMLSSEAGDAPIKPPLVTGRTQSNHRFSRQSSVDTSAINTLAPDTPVRKKILLQPKRVAVSTAPPDEKAKSSKLESYEVPTASHKSLMSEERAKAKVDEDIKEFFALKKLDEADNHFQSLPEQHRHILVGKLVARAFDGKEGEVELVADLFSRVSITSGCSAESFRSGLFPSIEYLDDIAIDVPQAYVYMAKLLKGSSLTPSVVESLAAEIIIDGEPLELPKDKLLKEFKKIGGYANHANRVG